MKITIRYISYLLFLGLMITSLYFMNLFSKRPLSIDHYLAKELIIGVLDSPEYMTYLGIFDGYGKILGHNKSFYCDLKFFHNHQISLNRSCILGNLILR